MQRNSWFPSFKVQTILFSLFIFSICNCQNKWGRDIEACNKLVHQRQTEVTCPIWSQGMSTWTKIYWTNKKRNGALQERCCLEHDKKRNALAFSSLVVAGWQERKKRKHAGGRERRTPARKTMKITAWNEVPAGDREARESGAVQQQVPHVTLIKSHLFRACQVSQLFVRRCRPGWNFILPPKRSLKEKHSKKKSKWIFKKPFLVELEKFWTKLSRFSHL
jgi:hypothetical protein